MATTATKDLVGQGVSLLDALRNDHKTVTKMMEEIMAAVPEEKGGLLALLDAAFARHADSEERYFYLSLRRFSGLAELINTALAEHDTIRELLRQLETGEIGTIGWQATCSDLEEILYRHFDKEEQIFFPRALRLMTTEEMNVIRDRIVEEQHNRPLPHRYREVMG